MAITTIIKEVKKIHPKEIALVKIGQFYHAYGRDSYIISYLFGYKLQIIEDNICMCGFPEKNINKICAKLENKKLNYMILDRKYNYEVDKIFDNKGLNKYDETYKRAHEFINLKLRVENISNTLMQNLLKTETKKQISKIEEIINAGRKI